MNIQTIKHELLVNHGYFTRGFSNEQIKMLSAKIKLDAIVVKLLLSISTSDLAVYEGIEKARANIKQLLNS